MRRIVRKKVTAMLNEPKRKAAAASFRSEEVFT